MVPAGWSRTAFIDARDVGRVAATVLTEPGHLRRAYTLSGEQSLTYTDVARILTGVLDRPITYTRPSEHDYLAALVEQDRPADYVAVQKMIYRVVRLNISAVPNRAVRTLTSTPATTFAQFARDHRQMWTAQPDPGADVADRPECRQIRLILVWKGQRYANGCSAALVLIGPPGSTAGDPGEQGVGPLQPSVEPNGTLRGSAPTPRSDRGWCPVRGQGS